MKSDSQKLRFTTWIISLVFVGFGLIFIALNLALSNIPWTFDETIFCGIYFTGLLIGRKWPLVGGIISLIPPFFGFITGGFGPLLLILMIPGILYLTSWYQEKKSEK